MEKNSYYFFSMCPAEDSKTGKRSLTYCVLIEMSEK